MTEKQALVLFICCISIWFGFALDLIIWKIKRSKAMKHSEFRVTRYKTWNGKWSIGLKIMHNDSGTYLHISLIKWNIAIGFFEKE